MSDEVVRGLTSIMVIKIKGTNSGNFTARLCLIFGTSENDYA